MTEGRNWAELLDRALAITVDDVASGEGDVRSLMDVAERHRGSAFGLDPIAVEMVHAILRSAFGVPKSGGDPWRIVAENVAQSMCGEPVLRRRLQALWADLQARVSS